MSSTVYVNTYTHSVTFVTDKMLTSLRKIITWSGLDPAKLVNDWVVLEAGIRTWLASHHLECVILEVHRFGALVKRWDFDVEYGYGSGDGSMWVDPDAIRYAIEKCGFDPARCDYTITAMTKLGRPAVPGWGPGTLLSTKGFVRHSIGTTIGADPLRSRAAYWRKL